MSNTLPVDNTAAADDLVDRVILLLEDVDLNSCDSPASLIAEVLLRAAAESPDDGTSEQRKLRKN